MAVIGEFTTNGNTILGHVRTLTVSMKARLNPIERTSRDAPNFRIMSGAAEVGAAWSQVSGDGEPYISVKLDDPSFPAPINAALWPTEKEGDYTLVWNRPKRDACSKTKPCRKRRGFSLAQIREEPGIEPASSFRPRCGKVGLLRVTNRAVSKCRPQGLRVAPRFCFRSGSLRSNKPGTPLAASGGRRRDP